MTDSLNTCKTIRQFAADVLCETLQEVFNNSNPISETFFRDSWFKKLRKNPTIFPDGWYEPPPHGIGVLFGTADKGGRQNYKSLRPEEMWPKKDIFLGDKNEMAYLFASPVDRKSDIIGDFGLTIYLGNKQEIKEHLRRCMQINLEIFNFIEVGRKFSEVYKYAEQIIAKHGLANEVTSTTDPTGRDFGHTVPASYFEWTREEKSILENGELNWESTKNMISKKRVFVSSVEKTTYQPGMAITLEPRLTVPDNPNIPMGSFHTIAVINEDGTKELLTNFDKIFEIVGMDYMKGLVE